MTNIRRMITWRYVAMRDFADGKAEAIASLAAEGDEAELRGVARCGRAGLDGWYQAYPVLSALHQAVSS